MSERTIKAIIQFVALAINIVAGFAVQGNTTGALSVHVLNLAACFGMSAWVTGVAGLVMIRVLERKDFATAQMALFPIYFFLQSVTLSAATLSLYTVVRLTKPQTVGFLSLATIMSVVQWLVLGPIQVSALRKRNALAEEFGGLDTEEAKASAALKSARKAFGMSHGFSALINLVVFLIVTVHVCRVSTWVQVPK